MRASWRKVTAQEMAALEAQGIVVRAVGKVDEEEIQTLVFSNAGEWTKVSALSSSPAVLTKVHRPGLFSWRWRLEMGRVGLS